MIKLAAAQIACKIGEIQHNLEQHYLMINFAANKGANLIVFPELSITGYCREESKKLAFTVDDNRLNELIRLSHEKCIIIIAGAPVVIENKLYITSLIINPDQSIKIYTKQYLHTGEELFYNSSMHYDPVIKIGKEQISLAICADIVTVNHPKNAKSKKSTIYIPSIFYSKEGIDNGHDLLANYAKDFSLNILMSNYCGSHWKINSGGKSGFWNNKGECLTQLPSNSSGIIIIEKHNDTWISNSFKDLKHE